LELPLLHAMAVCGWTVSTVTVMSAAGAAAVARHGGLRLDGHHGHGASGERKGQRHGEDELLHGDLLVISS
jgi:hypothetical protein